ncbi:polygalacturonase-1 non-catalytic subunit beta-like [Impatiens glandulifera]|uniref:polygalacturonase-1 non-catalytic subunit beta-like n=1 Tax=Impatiens glandulifera TaxID=253017 RepID=UPI001FB0E5B8|nr:polygalacturonase-1 non-catalytic subunit beta-like [Impatiens glandulifera]
MNYLCFIFIFFLSPFTMVFAGAGAGEGVERDNPFTPKASLIRYWNKEISNNLPKPWFLINKASPLNSVDSAVFVKLAGQNDLKSSLPSFCSKSNLLCFPDLEQSLDKHDKDSNFAIYLNKNFTNYGTSRLGGFDSFKNYSDGENIPVDSFRRYSRDSTGHVDKFANYAPEVNVGDQSFNTYGTKATGGAGEFKNYMNNINVPNLRFTSYSDDTNGRKQTFTSYSDISNSGDQKFNSYGKNGNGAAADFSSYGKESNVIGSNFAAYGEVGNSANDSFVSYGETGNNPTNSFKSYGDGGNSAIDTFKTYRDQSNVGDDSFTSYAKNSNAAKVGFTTYKSFNEGTDIFTGYGKGGQGQKIGFKNYGVNTTFKDYADKNAVSFSSYATRPPPGAAAATAMMGHGGMMVNKWIEPGKFFKEEMLKTGNVMPMPDIKDKMPKRSFLPRLITSKLPFSTSKLPEMKNIFHAGDGSAMETMMTSALSDCERAASKGENKRCVGSAEDMIDFAISVLGRNVVVRTTENTDGSKKDVMVGSVKGINGGKVTKSVSCHQTLFPYLLYYCHSVPKVRVYEADLLDPKTKVKVNHGVAICHLDTSDWSATHGAFMALGSSPGKTEVCHWIFENDMTWATAD